MLYYANKISTGLFFIDAIGDDRPRSGGRKRCTYPDVYESVNCYSNYGLRD